jgi:uncharacterized protein YbjT (DUF2867 family)
MNLLITGATGEVGSRVVAELLEHAIRPRLLVRNSEKARALFHDRVEIFSGDLADPASAREAFKGIDTLYLLNIGPEIPQRDKIAAVIAREEGVSHIVKLSSLDVEYNLAIGAWHEKGEAAIRATGVPYTFVRPTGFMSNLLAWAPAIKAEGIVRSSTAGGRRPFIHPADVASVSVAALLNGKYANQALSITGPESLTFADFTASIAEAIGKPLSYQVLSDDEARQRYARVSGSPEETEAHVALWRAIRENRLADTTDDVEKILGRKPRALPQWIAENLSAFIGAPAQQQTATPSRPIPEHSQACPITNAQQA